MSHAENFVKVQVDPPKVRTVEEILEQTRCILPHEFASVAPSEMEISRDSPIMAESVSKMVKYQGRYIIFIDYIFSIFYYRAVDVLFWRVLFEKLVIKGGIPYAAYAMRL